MATKAVFLDRDNTLMEDPGYLAEPAAVKLLPGVELALKSLAQSGYRLVVVTNQSAVARGLLTIEGLEGVHEELRRQLAERGAELDGIYYCPYLPEGSVEQFARDSDERKPKPGMLLRAASELDIDLAESWMVGDSPRDIEAGQRAGCRTVRVRIGREASHASAGADEDVQADFTVRHLVDAARVILRETQREPAEAPAAPNAPAMPKPPDAPPTVGAAKKAATPPPVTATVDGESIQELLQHARQLLRMRLHGEFSVTKLIAGLFQGVALLTLVIGLVRFVGMGSPMAEQDTFWLAMAWLAIAAVLQLIALTFFVMGRND